MSSLARVEAYPLFRYRLEPGERFAIVGTARRSVRVRLRPGAPAKELHHLDVRFVLACEVTASLRGELVTIVARMREVTVRGEIAGKPVFLLADGSMSADGWRKMLITPFRKAVGDEIEVTKSLFGPISHVIGGAKTHAVLGGAGVQDALTWYGAKFPEYRVRPGEVWTESFDFGVGPSVIGVPLPGRHALQVRCDYQAMGWERFGDLQCPSVAERLSIRGDSTWGPLRVSTRGKGEGRVLPNLRDGKIARSQKHAELSVQLHSRIGGVRLAELECELSTDSWHE